jgi:hypothetical protein
MIWNRRREGGYETDVNDKVRGAPLSLFTAFTQEETNFGGSPGMPTITQDGCTVSTDGSYNGSGGSFVLNFWKRAPQFFDEVCYTGTGANASFTHSLGVVPELMIVKRRSASGAWMVNSQYLAADARLELQSTSAVKATPEFGDVWNNTRPTSTVFTVGTDSDVNASGGTYVNYLFATCAGVSKVGTYTGQEAAFNVDCGFTSGARFILIKNISFANDWYVWDSARGIIAGNEPYLRESLEIYLKSNH